MSTKTAIILANFGGPRSLVEIEPFLIELLTDVDVIRTPLPRFFDRWFFTRVAKKRAPKIAKDYELIGGKSPIFEDTEEISRRLQAITSLDVIPFHRYLPATHAEFLNTITEHPADQWIVLPMYPQFSFSTTGSIARFFSERLSAPILQKMRWLRSYATHPRYIEVMQNCIRDFLSDKNLKEEETFLFFSAHGLPQKYVDQGDPYQTECRASHAKIAEAFPQAASLLAFQSKFGRGEWLRPYTSELCQKPTQWSQGRKNIVFVPLSFTSDHLETLYEIEYTYLRDIQSQGLRAYRCPALNLRYDWIEVLSSFITKIDSPQCPDRQTLLDVCDSIPCRDRMVLT